MTIATEPATDAQSNAQDGTGQHLTFVVQDEEYGVDILRVQGIQGWDQVTPIPNTPDYVLGVINLRGTVVPIYDMRRRFGLQPTEFGPTTVVIVVRVESSGSEKIVGMVVDAVSEVYRIDTQSLKPAPDFGATIDTQFIRGLATIEDKMVILLDVDKLLDVDAATPPGTTTRIPAETELAEATDPSQTLTENAP